MVRNPSGPLTRNELQRLQRTLDTIEGKGRHHLSLPVAIIPFTGLYPAEYCHLTRDWITFPKNLDWDADEPIIIRVPESQECPRLRLKQGHVHQVEEACPHCRKTNGPDRWERRYESRDRTIEVMAEPARDAFRSWFAIHDAIPHSVPSLSENVTRVAEAAGFGRKITATSLRKTFPVMLAKMGFPIDYIIETAGYSCKARLPDEALKVYREREGLEQRTTWPTNELLQYLAGTDIVGTAQIETELGWARGSLVPHLARLRDMGIIDQTGQDGRENLWRFDGDPVRALSCPVKGCSNAYVTLQSLSTHLAKGHATGSD